LARYSKTQRNKIIDEVSLNPVDQSVLKTPLADFIPVTKKNDEASKIFAKKVLGLCNQSGQTNEVVIAALALALFSSVNNSYSRVPNPSDAIH